MLSVVCLPQWMFISKMKCSPLEEWLHISCQLTLENTLQQLRMNEWSYRASLVVQCLRICVPIERTCVSPPDLGRSHMLRSSKPHSHNYCAHVPGDWSLRAWEPVLCTRETTTARPPCTATREESPPAAARESPRAAVTTQCSTRQYTQYLKKKWRQNDTEDLPR